MMKLLTKYIQQLLLITVAALFSTSCKKLVTIDEPIDRNTTTKVFSDDQGAVAAVQGIYAQMNITLPYIFSGGTTIYAGLSADELRFTGTTADVLAFQSNNIAPGSSIIANDHWQRAYAHIYHVNACLEGLAQAENITADTRKQLTGELKFLRAYMYYYLVNLFGDVPLIVTTAYQENSSLPRTSSANMYNQITEDLVNAKSLLPATYPSALKARPNKWAATALLARVYLHHQQWAAAEAECNLIIQSAQYTLSSLNNVFLANSTEAIWQLAPVFNNFNTTEGARFVPASATAIPTYTLSSWLLNAFEANDQRKTAWTRANTVNNTPYHYPFKYKIRSNATVTEHYTMLRLAEQYLIRAEARAQQDKWSLSAADINMIRGRAGLGNTTAADKSGLLNAIEQERRIEFFAEWGHRWIDLKRTGRVDAVMQPVKTGWLPHKALYPIPLSQLNLNPALTQNNGY